MRAMILLLLLLGLETQAQLPVTDVGNLAQNRVEFIRETAQDVKQFAQMIKDYEQMLRDFENQTKQLKAVVGGRGMGQLRNTLFDKEFIRRYVPADWDLAQNLRYGSPSSGALTRYGNRLRELMQRYALPEVGQSFAHMPAASNSVRNVYDDRLRSSQASMATAYTAQWNTEQRLATIEALMTTADLDGETADLKRSLDLNTRMTAEAALLQADQIRLLSQLLGNAALEEQQQLSSEDRRRRLVNYGD